MAGKARATATGQTTGQTTGQAAGQASGTLDLESRLGDDDHEAVRLWLRMLTCTNLIEGQLRGRLRRECDESLARFDLMAQLERHPRGLKMRELSRRLMVTGGNVTGLTDKLVLEGHVERREDPRDRRAFTVHLTAAGRRHFRRTASRHEGWVIELMAGLAPAEKQQLIALLLKLKQHLVALPGPSDGAAATR